MTARPQPDSVDCEWLERLWHEHGDRIFAYAARRVGLSHAEDVMAEVFIVAWRHRDKRPKRELPWLYGVARKVVSEHYRSQNRWEHLVDRIRQEHGQFVGFDDGPDITNVLGALAQLNDADREIILLIAWDELTPSEVAMIVGVSGSVLRMRLSRARRRLQRLMSQESPTTKTT